MFILEPCNLNHLGIKPQPFYLNLCSLIPPKDGAYNVKISDFYRSFRTEVLFKKPKMFNEISVIAGMPS